MKRTLLAICVGTMALAIAASAEEPTDQPANTGKARRAAVQRSQATTAEGQHRQFTRQQNASTRAAHQRTTGTQTGATVRAQRTSRERGFRQADRTDRTAVTGATRTNRIRGENFRRNQEVGFNRDRNVAVNRTRNVNRNVTVVNNWRSQRFASAPYRAFYNYNRQWHDRGWWRSHYDRLIFVSGGWWFWNSGFWFPAWGYDPGYVYPYDGPIYGYGGLTPDQVVANVQVQLRNDGYYDGGIDGVLGPQTREALAEFQADHGLAVTSAVDQPTLSTLGLA